MITNISIAPQTWQKTLLGVVGREFASSRFRRECLKMNNRTPPGDMKQFEDQMRLVILQRDIAAYELIFKYFAPRIKAYMMKLTADRQLAEELMQETMITVWRKASHFDSSKGALSTWIFTIARNLRIDAIRREKRPKFDPEDPAFIPDEAPAADSIITAQQSADALRHAMERLPTEQSELLKMSFYDDYSQSIIAAKMNIPLGTVKSRMRLAFDKLRIALSQSGGVS